MHFGLQLVLANGNSVFLVDPTSDGYALLLVSYVTLIEHPHASPWNLTSKKQIDPCFTQAFCLWER